MTKPTFFATPAAFRVWLDANHATKTEVLVGFYKISTGKPSITWSESVDEALCFGWIDGVRRSLGDQAYSIRFTPRKPTSFWSAINVAKVAQLRKANKMLPAGEAAFAKRTPDKTGYSSESMAAQFSAVQLAQFKATPEAHAWFTSQAPSYQKVTTHWVMSAKKDETRSKRLAELIHHSARGERLPQLVKYTKPAAKKPAAKKPSTKARTKARP
ncbi:MAG: YdeI/OmpD-associated family protein [Kofleriaceae bacterium]